MLGAWERWSSSACGPGSQTPWGGAEKGPLPECQECQAVRGPLRTRGVCVTRGQSCTSSQMTVEGSPSSRLGCTQMQGCSPMEGGWGLQAGQVLVPTQPSAAHSSKDSLSLPLRPPPPRDLLQTPPPVVLSQGPWPDSQDLVKFQKHHSNIIPGCPLDLSHYSPFLQPFKVSSLPVAASRKPSGTSRLHGAFSIRSALFCLVSAQGCISLFPQRTGGLWEGSQQGPIPGYIHGQLQLRPQFQYDLLRRAKLHQHR